MDIYVVTGIGVLLVNTVLIGVLVGRRPKPPVKPMPEASSAPTLPLEVRERLEQRATAAFETAVEKATAQFGQDLEATSSHLNALIVKLTTDIVERELKEYKKGIEAARQSAIENLGQVQRETLERQKALQNDLEAQVSQRRQQLLERVDQRLGEAAVAYIVESLGQGADLGAQRSWLLESLERHKADLKKDLANAA